MTTIPYGKIRVTSDNNVRGVTIKNQWLFRLHYPQPGAAEAQTISQQTQLIVNGTTHGLSRTWRQYTISIYTLSISYNRPVNHPAFDIDPSCWIPQGCSYSVTAIPTVKALFNTCRLLSFHLAPYESCGKRTWKLDFPSIRNSPIPERSGKRSGQIYTHHHRYNQYFNRAILF